MYASVAACRHVARGRHQHGAHIPTTVRSVLSSPCMGTISLHRSIRHTRSTPTRGVSTHSKCFVLVNVPNKTCGYGVETRGDGSVLIPTTLGRHSHLGCTKLVRYCTAVHTHALHMLAICLCTQGSMQPRNGSIGWPRYPHTDQHGNAQWHTRTGPCGASSDTASHPRSPSHRTHISRTLHSHIQTHCNKRMWRGSKGWPTCPLVDLISTTQARG